MAAKKGESGETFEDLYRRLEETVAKLETGNLALEESISLYEEGTRLAKRCQEILQGAELRISRLQEQLSGPAPDLLRDGGGAYGAELEEEPLYDE